MREPMKLRCAKCEHLFNGPMDGMVLAACADYLKSVHCPSCGVGADHIFLAPETSVEIRGEVS